MLDTLRGYSDAFGSVKLTQGVGPKAITIEVNFAEAKPAPQKRPKKEVTSSRMSAIDALSMTPPAFEFEQ